MKLYVLSAGAAKSVVEELQPGFTAEASAELVCTFAPVGVIREQVLEGIRADVIILTETMLVELTEGGHIAEGTMSSLGKVWTGVAHRVGEPAPDVSTPEALRAVLLECGALFSPDPEHSTAGRHFAGVLRQLGIYEEVHDAMRSFPNGAAAMAALAASTEPGAIGCTQVSEILHAAGVNLVGLLPADLGLSTEYSAAISASAAEPELALRFVRLLTSANSREIRAAAGFEV